MKTFILIPGSWHSAWNWHCVVPLLEKAGHYAIALDLPGMGRDKTPIQTVKIKDAVQSLCDHLDAIDGKVILVGHSKNDSMISQVAEYRAGKIEKLSCRRKSTKTVYTTIAKTTSPNWTGFGLQLNNSDC